MAGAVAGKGGFPVVIARADGLDMGGMRNKWDVLRAKLPESAAVVLYGENDGKPVLMAAATDAAVAAGFDAVKVIKAMGPAIKGGGGGRANMATAGGKDAAGLEAAAEAAKALLL